MSASAIISGVADTAVGKVVGSSCLGLHAQATTAALADAGLQASDIDGVLCAYSITEPHMMLASVFSEYYGIAPKFSAAVQAGGATACIMIIQAAALVASGFCRHVLCVTGDNRLTGGSRDRTVAFLSEFGHGQFERPYGINIPAAYGLVAQRYMHEFGLTEEQLAAIAVTHRNHARRHPKAQMRDPLTIEQAMTARFIAEPLRLFDCCQISDGGAAVIVSAPDTRHDLKSKPIEITGYGQMNTHEHIIAAPSLVDFGCKQSSQQAFGMAGILAGDIDVAEIYDSFTITLLVELESIGFFARGEAGEAALAGELDLGGCLPCNTHGGLLSYAHSGAAGGMFHIVEAVHQLRGQAAVRQVEDAGLAYVHGDGGVLSAHASLVLAKV